MDRSDKLVGRLTRSLDRIAALRVAAGRPGLAEARERLRSWQAARLARTHADLLASPRTGAAAAFFLSDLYGARELTRIDEEVRRIVPAMSRLLPESGLRTVADAIEMEALSEDLDVAMACVLASGVGPVDATRYGAAYREVGRRRDRLRQILLVRELGEALDELVGRPMMGATLSMMHWPAHLAGLGHVQDFLQRGYRAFASLGGAQDFLRRVVGRERALLEALFRGDDRPLLSPQGAPEPARTPRLGA